MLPAEYVSEIVLPTVNEYLAAMGDRRRGYLACIASYHVRDYLHRAEGVGKLEIDRRMREKCAISFDVVEGISNGSKHCGNDRGDFRFAPGAEEVVLPFAFDVGGGFDHSRWDVPGLVVEHDGHRLLVDFCLCSVLWSFGALFPLHLGQIDFSAYRDRVPGDRGAS